MRRRWKDPTQQKSDFSGLAEPSGVSISPTPTATTWKLSLGRTGAAPAEPAFGRRPFLQKIYNSVELVDFNRREPPLQVFNSLLGLNVGSEILFRLMAIALSLTILTNHY